MARWSGITSAGGRVEGGRGPLQQIPGPVIVTMADPDTEIVADPPAGKDAAAASRGGGRLGPRPPVGCRRRRSKAVRTAPRRNGPPPPGIVLPAFSPSRMTATVPTSPPVASAAPAGVADASPRSRRPPRWPPRSWTGNRCDLTDHDRGTTRRVPWRRCDTADTTAPAASVGRVNAAGRPRPWPPTTGRIGRQAAAPDRTPSLPMGQMPSGRRPKAASMKTDRPIDLPPRIVRPGKPQPRPRRIGMRMPVDIRVAQQRQNRGEYGEVASSTCPRAPAARYSGTTRDSSNSIARSISLSRSP